MERWTGFSLSREPKKLRNFRHLFLVWLHGLVEFLRLALPLSEPVPLPMDIGVRMALVT